MIRELRNRDKSYVRFVQASVMAVTGGCALVNAFNKLHIVLAANSGYCGSKYSRWTSGSRLLGASSLPSMNAE
jgi:hypothetical protein